MKTTKTQKQFLKTLKLCVKCILNTLIFNHVDSRVKFGLVIPEINLVLNFFNNYKIVRVYSYFTTGLVSVEFFSKSNL